MTLFDNDLATNLAGWCLPVAPDYDLRTCERSIYALFEEHANRAPDAIAVIGADDGEVRTYGQLRDGAERICAALHNRGLRPEEPVGLFHRRSVDAVAALLGILRAGAAYVPLDPAEPVARARTLAVRAELAVVLGDAPRLDALRAAYSGTNEGVPDLVDVAELLTGNEPVKPEGVGPGGHQLAYVLFTSGSTGAPKGVEVEHRNVVNLLLAARQAFGFTAADRYLATSTFSFDISVAEIFLPLISGASVVLGDKQLLLQRGGVARTIAEHGVTVFQTGPSVWAILLDGPVLPRLRVAVTTGEAISTALATRLVSVADQVWNLYGPTETTIWCSGHRLDAPGGLQGGTEVAAPLGQMWPNMPGVIVDERGDPVGEHEVGELWVGGLAVTRGYRRDEDKTAERYVARRGDRYYRTGDLVRLNDDGALVFVGRNDDQIQIHGIRTEPMEVEASVAEDTDVERVATTWYADSLGAKSIAAGVVLRNGGSVDAVRTRLLARLPQALVPSRFVLYDALPLNANGKIDRVAIRTAATESLSAAAVDPGAVDEVVSATEHVLRDIWRRVLRVQQVGRHDSFFALGGDSLAAVGMLLDVEEALGIQLPARVVMDAPTIAELGNHIDLGLFGRDDRRGSTLFQLVHGGDATPVFFCAIELHLARPGVWKLDCPLYAVNYWMLGVGFARARTLRDLVNIHVAEILAVQPHGPYRVAGFSFGGIVAVEIARELRNRGEDIELVFLLDPTEPYRSSVDPDNVRVDEIEQAQQRRSAESLPHRIVRHATYVLRHPRDAKNFISQRIRSAPDALFFDRRVWPWLQYRLVDMHGRYPNALTTRLLPKDRWPAFWYVTRKLAREHIVEPYDGDVLAVFLEQNQRQMAWKPLLPDNADVRYLQTDHRGLVLEPALSDWLAALRERLEGQRADPS